MSPSVAVGLVVIAAGALGGVPGVAILGALAVTISWLSELWSRHGLARVTYTRRLTRDRAVWGDRVALDVTVHNAKLLPLGWLQADDFASESLVVEERPLLPSDRPGLGILRNVWALGPFERVDRRVHVVADHRGRYELSRVALSVADLFGRAVATAESTQPAHLIVRPRTVPVRSEAASVTLEGARRARRGLHEDPALFAGVRPFQPGDSRRRVHARASARVGRPVSKRFEPPIARDVVVALDVQTHEGPHWLLAYDEDVMESLAVTAASLARRFLADGAACGLVANGWTWSPAHTAVVAPRAGQEQLTRIADMLGRLSSIPSLPFEDVLAGLPARVPGGALVWIVSSRDVAALGGVLRGLRAAGFELRLVALGPHAAAHAARARRLGIEAVVALLRPDWRSCDAVALAS